MKLWDYTLKKGWKPETEGEWQWYLERKIHYDDWEGVKPWMLKKYASFLKLDPGKHLMVQAYIERYGRRIKIPAYRSSKNHP